MRLTAILFLVTSASLLGCGQETSEKTKADPSPIPQEFATVDEAFAGHNARPEDLRLSVEQVEQEIIGTGRWEPFKLTETGIGKYDGNAITKNGREFEIEVRQTAGGIYWRWTNEEESWSGSAMTTW